MKGGIVEINWHDSQPVLTLDFNPKSSLLATGGNDRDIKLWTIFSCDSEKKVPRASYHSSLSYHSSAVNTLRFSPSGEQLASGADGGELVIWKLHAMEDGDSWKVSKRLLHHQKDVLDVEWSADGAHIISGSVDNLCIIWDANKGQAHQVLDAHFHYVQGVAWDPLGGYIASVSSDRTCRIYAKKMQGKVKGLHKMTYVCQHVITKTESQKPVVSKTPSNKTHLFHDETLPSFFRRLSWSPDGSFLLVPGGIQKISPASASVNTAYVISRNDLSRPAVQLPGASKPIVAVRFCPILFQLQESHSASGFFKLPYGIVFAVATLNSLYVYDTESGPPIAIFAGLHYAAITDIAWSPDGKYLAVSSRDCYCTLVEFENNELGSPVPQHVLAKSVCGSMEPTNLKLDETQRMEIDNLEVKLANLGEDVKAVEKRVLFPEAEKPAGEFAEGIQGNTDCTSLRSDVTPNTEIKNAMAYTANMMAGNKVEEKKHALLTPTDNSTKTGKKRITPVAIV